MFVFFLCLSLLASAFAAPPPLVGGFRPVPPSIGGPIGVKDASASTNDRASLPIWEGGHDVKPWLASQPRLHPN